MVLIDYYHSMAYRDYNYSAFYVAEPFSETSLGAYATKDFVYYNVLKAWKSKDDQFPFKDAHNTTYNVRDDSSWECTLKPRLHERLRNSKNIILFLSKNTRYSRALKEELDYGINELGLPVIIVYPDFNSNSYIASDHKPNNNAKALWEKLPILKDNIHKIPTAHVPMDKEYIYKALCDPDFTIQKKSACFCWCYS